MICEKTIARQLVTVISLLILVSAGISRSFDSAMLVTTQIHMQKISQVLLVVYISRKNPNTVKASAA